MQKALAMAAKEAKVTTHVGGTYLCMEGPQFSTRAESHMYRGFGVSVIGMTNLPEAKLAREAELHYCVLAFPSDYDCWRTDEEHVSVDNILDLIKRNTETAKTLVRATIANWHGTTEPTCDCARALHRGMMTPSAKIPPRGREILSVLAPDLLSARGTHGIK
jgi:5'-methylthioadenosine phosphorylase